MIEPARRSVVRSSPVRRFLDHDVGICKLPAPPAGPVLERGVAEGAKQPSPARKCSLKACNPDLDVVNEAGASVYSASEFAAREFPDLDVSLRGAVSIGRRLIHPRDLAHPAARRCAVLSLSQPGVVVGSMGA